MADIPTADIIKALRLIQNDERVDFHARGYAEAGADLIERLTAALKSLTKDPPASFAREPDEDAEIIIKMRAIAAAALTGNREGEKG